MSENDEQVPEFVIGDDDAAILNLLRELQRGVLLHPEAARALFNGFAAEGRAYASTLEGRRCKEMILRSRLLERAAHVWHASTLWITEEPESSALPSAVVDAMASVAASPRRDELLGTLLRDAGEGR
jgi:hypothetical protein